MILLLKLPKTIAYIIKKRHYIHAIYFKKKLHVMKNMSFTLTSSDPNTAKANMVDTIMKKMNGMFILITLSLILFSRINFGTG